MVGDWCKTLRLPGGKNIVFLMQSNYTDQCQVYEILLYLFTPFILPISLYVRPSFCAYLLAATIGMYLINVIIFNEVHLRRKNERVSWVLLYVYYIPYKIILTGISVASCYWSMYKYARYFARRHPKVIEDEKAVEVVIRLEEDKTAPECGIGRRMTVCTFDTRLCASNYEGEDRRESPREHVETEGGTYCIVEEPEQAHTLGMQQGPARVSTTAPSSPLSRSEGVIVQDYFTLNHVARDSDEQDVDLEKQERRMSTMNKLQGNVDEG
jgi:hypothetical protein